MTTADAGIPYYVTWMECRMPGIAGSQVLPFPGDFNLFAAHEWLRITHGRLCVVTSWQRITPEQAEQFGAFVMKHSGPGTSPTPPPLAPVISIRQEQT